MVLQRLIFANAALFALAACRIAGYVVVALAWLSTSFASSHAVPRELDFELAGKAVLELACGLVVGIAFRFVFAAAEVLGSVLGQTTGLSSASVLNPTMDAPESPVARVVGLCAMLVALAAGVHRVALGSLLESFRSLPVGTAAVLDAPLLRFVDLGIDAFVVGVRLSTPVVAVALLAQLSLALISRAAPSVQIFSVGFAVLFTSGVVSLLACLDGVVSGLAAHFASLGPFLDETLSALQR
jgi:flagellar biosynthetic protein FliR